LSHAQLLHARSGGEQQHRLHLVLEEERMIAKEREEQAGVELVRFGIMVTAQRRRRDKGQFGILLFSFIFIVFHYYS